MATPIIGSNIDITAAVTSAVITLAHELVAPTSD